MTEPSPNRQSFSPGRPLVVGTDHRSSSMRLRDRLHIDEAARQGFFERLRRSGLSQALILSFADRIDVLALAQDCERAAPEITSIMADHAGASAAEIGQQTYVKTDAEALRHLFAVTAAVDGLVVGDQRVRDLVAEAHGLAREAGMSGAELDAMCEAAYRVAGRVLAETAVGSRAVSIASAAQQVAHDLHGDLARCAGLLVGAGEMGETVAAQLLSAGLADLVITHPTEQRADALAKRLDCHTAPMERLDELVEAADVLLTSMNTRRYTIGPEMMEAAIKARRRKPVLLIDTGIPGDVAPAVDALEDAFRYTLDDLERVAREGKSRGEHAARSAWEIVEAEVARFADDQAGLAVEAAARALEGHYEEARKRALEAAGGDAERATRLLVDALLAGPVARLREGARADEEDGEVAAMLRLMRQLHGLDGSEPEDGR